MEEWRDIKGFERYYQISSLGRVRSLTRFIPSARTIQGIMMATRINNKGYECLGLRREKKLTQFTVHRLVALAFLPAKKGKNIVNHINGVKTDNTLENLEWVNQSENIKHAFELGLSSQQGERHASSKLKEADVRAIRRRYVTGEGLSSIAKDFKVSKSSICIIGKRKRWKHLED